MSKDLAEFITALQSSLDDAITERVTKCEELLKDEDSANTEIAEDIVFNEGYLNGLVVAMHLFESIQQKINKEN